MSGLTTPAGPPVRLAEPYTKPGKGTLLAYQPLGGRDYRLTGRCQQCGEEWQYTQQMCSTKSVLGRTGKPQFNPRKYCDTCRTPSGKHRKAEFAARVREGWTGIHRQAYLDAVAPGSQLYMELPSVQHPHWQRRDPLLDGIRDPNSECEHGRLPGDSSRPCGCWGAEDSDARRARQASETQ